MSRSSRTPISSRRSTTRGCRTTASTAIVDENADARLDALRTSLSVLAVLALLALFFSRGLPTTPAAAAETEP